MHVPEIEVHPRKMALEQYVAIDNVCAWPNLTQLADGKIIATIFNQPVHGLWEGDIDCWSSEDGRFWNKSGTPAPHEPQTVRMNVAAGTSASGDMIVLASGWDNRNPVGEPSMFTEANTLPMWICRSSDAGQSWVRESGTLLGPSGEVVIPFGDIVKVDSQTLGCAVYCAARTGFIDKKWTDDGRPFTSMYFHSKDDGHTWSYVSTISDGGRNETALLSMGNGRLLTTARTEDSWHLQLFSSEDSGQSWQDRGPVSLSKQIPGHMLLLKDGRILLTYGIRYPDAYGIGYRISADQGETWGDPATLVHYGDRDSSRHVDGGYPSSVQLESGEIVTAYYTAYSEAHTRYHMGVVRWTAESR